MKKTFTAYTGEVFDFANPAHVHDFIIRVRFGDGLKITGTYLKGPAPNFTPHWVPLSELSWERMESMAWEIAKNGGYILTPKRWENE